VRIDAGDLAVFDERGIAAVAVNLQDAGEVAQIRFGTLQFMVGGIEVGDHRGIIATSGPVITGIGPQLIRLMRDRPTDVVFL